MINDEFSPTHPYPPILIYPLKLGFDLFGNSNIMPKKEDIAFSV
jgi:hypothetical protein